MITVKTEPFLRVYLNGQEIQNMNDHLGFRKQYPSVSGGARVLAFGLGIGLDTDYLLSFPIRKLTVIEKEKEFIDYYISSHKIIDPRLEIINADCREYVWNKTHWEYVINTAIEF